MKQYDQFRDIRIEESGLLLNNNKDTLYSILRLNNIITLKDLFEKYDQNVINFGKFEKQNYYFEDLALKGRVELIRYKYLGTILPFEHILYENIGVKDNSSVDKKEYQDIVRRNYYYASHLGLTRQMIGCLFFKEKKDATLIELIISEYGKDRGYNYSKLGLEMYVRILELLIKYHNEKEHDYNNSEEQNTKENIKVKLLK